LLDDRRRAGLVSIVGCDAFWWSGSMQPSFDKRILVLGLVVLCALAARPVERMRVDPATTGSIVERAVAPLR